MMCKAMRKFCLNEFSFSFCKRFLCFALFFALSGIFCAGAAEILTSGGTKTYKDAKEFELSGDVSINLLEIENNSGQIVIDLKGYQLNVTTLRIGYYDIFTKYNGNVKFCDTSAGGGGVVNIDSINATAWNQTKTIEIESPVVVNVSGNFDADTMGVGGDSANLKVLGNGTLNVTGSVNGDSYLNVTDIQTNGIVSGIGAVSVWKWTGGDSNWDNSGNWDSGSVPPSDGSAIVIIQNMGASPVYDGDIKVKDLTLESGSKLTISSPGNLIVGNDFVCNGKVDIFGNIEVGANFLFYDEVKAGGEIVVSGDVLAKGTIISSGNQTFEGLCTLYGNTVFSAGSNLVPASAKNIVFGKTGIAKSFYGTGYSATIKGNGIFYGDNEFDSLAIDNSDFGEETTVCFEGGKLQKIKEISAKGNSEANKLILASSDGTGAQKWKVYFESSPLVSDFKWTKIKYSESLSEDGSSAKELNIIPALENVVDALPSEPSAVSWFIHKYYWKGSVDSKWSSSPATNWSYDEEGNLAAPVPSWTDGLSEIILKKTPGQNDLELAGDTAVSDTELKLKSLSIEENNRFGLAEHTLKLTSDSDAVINKGIFAVYGTQSGAIINVAGGGSIVHDDNSVIEYYGDADSAKGLLYVSQSGASPNVINNFNHIYLNKTGGAITFENEVNAKSINSNQDTSGASVSYEVIFENAITVTDSTKNCIFGNSANESDGIVHDEVKVRFKGNADITVAEKFTVWGPVSIDDDISISVNSGKNIYLNGDVSAIGKKVNMKAESGVIQFRKKIEADELSINCGTLNINPSVTASPDSTVQAKKVSITGDVKLVDSNAHISCTESMDVAGNFFNEGGSVNSTGKITVEGSIDNQGNIVCGNEFLCTGETSNSGTVTCSLTGSDVEFRGKYSGSGTLIASSGITIFNDNVDFSSGEFVHNSGTVIIKKNGAEAFINKNDGFTSFYNLNIGDSISDESVTCKNDFFVEHDLNIFKPFECQEIKFNGETNLNTQKSFIAESVSIETGKTLNCGNSSVSIKKNFSNNGTFNCENSKISFISENETEISGETIFYDFECSVPGKHIKFQNEKTQSITHNFFIRGAGVTPEDYTGYIYLLSQNSGNSWLIDCTGATVDVQYAYIQDSNNLSMELSSSRILVARNSMDNGNNDNWNFPGMVYKWSGNVDEIWHKKQNWIPASIPGDEGFVEIPNVLLSGGSGNFPKSDEAVKAAKITVDAGSVIDLNGKNLVVTGADPDSWKNNGTIKTQGVEAISFSSAEGAVNENGKWLFYKDGGIVQKITNLNFNEIEVSAALNIQGEVTASSLIISGDASNRGSLTCVNDVTLDAKVILASEPSTSDSSAFSFNNAGYGFVFKKIIQSVNSGDASFGVKFTGSGTTVLKNDLFAKNIEVESPLLIYGKKVQSYKNQLYKENVTIVSDLDGIDFEAIFRTGKITFEKNIIGNGENIDFGKTSGLSDSNKVVLSGNVSGFKTISLFYPAEIKTDNGDVTLSAIDGILFNKDAELTGLNKVIFDSLVDSGSVDSSGVNINLLVGSETYRTSVEFKRKVGSVKPLGSICVYGSVYFDVNLSFVESEKTLSTTGNQLFYGKIVSVNDIVLSAGTNLLAAGGAIQIGNDFSASGKKIILLSDTYISAKSEIDALILQIGNEFASGTRNLHVSALSAGISENVVINANAHIHGNGLFYGGNIKINGAFDVEKDFIALGSAYNSDDSGVNESGVSGLFAYKNPLRTAENLCAQISYSDDFKTILPDGQTIPGAGNFCANFQIDSGKTVTVRKNFYGNGTKFNSAGTWNLIIPDNDNATISFAELYNSQINNCVVQGNSSENGAWVCASENCSGSGNLRIDFGRPLIKEVKTVLDDVVFVSFVDSVTGNSKKIENSNNEISKAASKIKNSAGFYTSTFMDEDCTISTDGKGDLSQFYLRFGNGSDENRKWNTDANGVSAGNSASTDRNGKNHGHGNSGVIPYLNLPKAKSDLYATLKDCHKGRIAHYYSETPSLPADFSGASATAGATWTQVYDCAAPVLIAVKTGQEKHSAPDSGSQKEYDSHNFIEFSYSEAVNIGGISGKLLLPANEASLSAAEIENSKNVQASINLGGITNNPSGIGFKAAGLCVFESGFSETGASGSSDNVQVHSLYRIFNSEISGGSDIFQTHKLRLGIASYVDSLSSTPAGNINHWLGYISKAKMPEGQVTCLKNDDLTDVAGNKIDFDASGHEENHALMEIRVNETLPSGLQGIYGKWDVSGPVFAKYNSIVAGLDSVDFDEAVGFTGNPFSSYLDRIEFHLIDSESMLEDYDWWTKVGWIQKGAELDDVLHPAKESAGGAKPFALPAERSVGGIRYSSLFDKVSHFKYSVLNNVSNRNFIDNAIGRTVSSIFNSDYGGAAYVDEYDSLFFALKISDTNLPLKTTFEIVYDGNGWITDLAGNLLLPNRNTVIKSIDRVSPNFNISIASVKIDGGVDGDELYVVFSKALQTGNFLLTHNDGSTEFLNGLESIPKSLRIVSISEDGSSVEPSTDLLIDKNVPAKLVFSNRNYTGLILKLNRAVTLADMEKYYVQCYVENRSLDPISGAETNVTYVQDIIGNYMIQNTAHALTDFAVGVVNPIYAYDKRLLDDGSPAASEIYQEGSWAVHDWSRTQGNYGSLTYGYDMFLAANLSDGTESCSSMSSYIALYMASIKNLDNEELSNIYNRNIDRKLRIWIPEKSLDGQIWPVFDSISEKSNEKYGGVSVPVDSETPDKVNFDFSKLNFESFLKNEVGISSNDQILFLFGLQKDSAGTPVTICHAPEFSESLGRYQLPKNPLFALRLENKNDLTSIDLWSLLLKSTRLQRGGVTILNNVIDANDGEKTMVQVDMESEGSLNVVVMTLDGNIVQYLHRGKASAGQHFWTWNGTTKSGKKVARGLYFIRVFGNGIDETRKVMVVK